MTQFEWKRSPWIAATIGLLVCSAAAINALAFTSSTAIPLPISDAWYFIETFVRSALDHQLQVADLFIQRLAGDDHAQPLQKLVLLADLYWTNLDFRGEAILGILFAVVACLWISWSLIKDARTTRERRTALLGACVVFGVGLSLNATMVYVWYLVSLSWMSLLLVFVYWRTIGLPMSLRLLSLYAGAATFALALVLDELALPALVAAVVALTMRDGIRSPKPAAVVLISGAFGLTLARWLLQVMAPTAAASGAIASSFQTLMGVLTQPDSWKLIVIPLTASLAHPTHLNDLFAGHRAVQVLIAASLLIAHAGFWWRAIVGRNRPRPEVLVLSVATMLFFYALIAGIALTRVPVYGMDYVNQGRYVVFYQLNIIALALMFLAPQRGRLGEAPVSAPVPWTAVIAAILILGLQFPLSLAAWKSAPYIRQSALNMAHALDELARNPQQTPAAGCTPLLPICRAPVGVRQATMALLQRHQLSIFSPHFRTAYGLSGPPPGSAAADVSSRGPCDVHALDWGPRTAGNGRFNVQPDGRSAYWLKVDADSPDFTVEFEGHPIHTIRKGEVIAFAHSDEMQAAVARGTTLHFDLVCRGRKSGSFEVGVSPVPKASNL